MSVPCLREAAAPDDREKLIGFVCSTSAMATRNVGRREIDRSWAEALKTLLRYEQPDYDAIEQVLQQDDTTLALMYFHLHFHLVRKSGEWILV